MTIYRTTFNLLFANDTCLFWHIVDKCKSHSVLNDDLQVISYWSIQWKMQFNLDHNKQAQKDYTFWKNQIMKTLFLYYLTLSWRRPMSYRNQSIDLLRKSMDWFLYDIGLHHERVNNAKVVTYSTQKHLELLLDQQLNFSEHIVSKMG